MWGKLRAGRLGTLWVRAQLAKLSLMGPRPTEVHENPFGRRRAMGTMGSGAVDRVFPICVGKFSTLPCQRSPIFSLGFLNRFNHFRVSNPVSSILACYTRIRRNQRLTTTFVTHLAKKCLKMRHKISSRLRNPLKQKEFATP